MVHKCVHWLGITPNFRGFYPDFLVWAWLIKPMAICEWSQSLAHLCFQKSEGRAECSNLLIIWLVFMTIGLHPEAILDLFHQVSPLLYKRHSSFRKFQEFYELCNRNLGQKTKYLLFIILQAHDVSGLQEFSKSGVWYGLSRHSQ